jgi:hypothetical protein
MSKRYAAVQVTCLACGVVVFDDVVSWDDLDPAKRRAQQAQAQVMDPRSWHFGHAMALSMDLHASGERPALPSLATRTPHAPNRERFARPALAPAR